jgi:hypothetical protein
MFSLWDLVRGVANEITFFFVLDAVARTARTLATIWCSALPAAMSARIVAKTFPASSTAHGPATVPPTGAVKPKAMRPKRAVKDPQNKFEIREAEATLSGAQLVCMSFTEQFVRA